MWEPSQATLDKDINGLVLLASAGCRLFGELKHRETVYVLCGGKGTAPGCARHGSPKVPSVPASWASKIAPEFLANPTENGQRPQILRIACPNRAGGDDPGDGQKQKLQAVRFAARNMPFFDLDIDKEIRDGDFFAQLIEGYSKGLVEPNMMRGLQPVIPCRTTLEVIIPSRDGLSPDKWKETATLCPLDWPSNYSLLRLWHLHGSLQKTENNLRSQTGHSHMFASWTVHHQVFSERVLFRRPPVFEAETVLQDHIRSGG